MNRKPSPTTSPESRARRLNFGIFFADNQREIAENASKDSLEPGPVPRWVR